MLGRHLDRTRQKLRALLGDARACHSLGASYATGDHGDWTDLPDPRTAIRWYERGAKLGDPECQYNLGFLYLLGEGIAPDPRAAVSLLEQAAGQEFCEAIRLLADLCAEGLHGVAADPVRAEHWTRALSDHLARHPEDKRQYER